MNYEEIHRGKIALVEDEPSHALLMSYNLELRGMKVTLFESNELFLKNEQNSNFDLIIINVNFHDDEGLELYACIRNKKLEVPVLVVTTSPRIENSLCSDKAFDYLVKPFSIKMLIDKVNHLLGHHVMEKEYV